MNTTKASPFGTISMDSGMKDRKVILSTLWIFAMLNYLYADVFLAFHVSTISINIRALTTDIFFNFTIITCY
jgi:hypothetical protein